MTDFDDMSAKLDPLKREVLERVIHLTSGEATEADAAALRRWRAQSPAHAAAFTEMFQFWRNLRQAAQETATEKTDTLEQISSAQVIQLASRQMKVPQPRMARRAFLGGAIAASAAGLMLTRPPLHLWPSFSELAADYRTGTGERRVVALADGISVELNTQTSIGVRSKAGRHGIDLISGEVEITAENAGSVPFSVTAGAGKAIANKARFNIRRNDSTICVTCLDGNVQVEQGQRSLALQTNQQTSYTAQNMTAPTAIDPEIVTAWKAGLLIFHNEPLVDVIDEVNRYRTGRIVLADSDLGRMPMNGVFHLDRVDAVIAQISKLGVRVTSLPGGLVLIG